MADRAVVGRANQRAGRGEEQSCANLLALAGFVVWSLRDHGQRRGTKGVRYATNSPGVPDLWAVHHGAHLGVFWEVKAGGAKLTPDQQAFRVGVATLCTTAVLYRSGDRAVLWEWLVHHDLIVDHPTTLKARYSDQGRVVTRRRG